MNQEEVTQEMEDITGMTCFFVPVTDVYASVQWYRNNLGCEPTSHNPVQPGMNRAIMRFPERDGRFAEPGLRQTVPAIILEETKQSRDRLGFSLDSGKRHPGICSSEGRLKV